MSEHEMRTALLIAVPIVVFAVGAVVVMWRAPQEPAGMPAAARNAWQWALRRVLGARPRPPRHATTRGRVVIPRQRRGWSA